LSRPATDTPPVRRPGETRAPVTLRCWGTRGSIPSPGPRTARYGGNTTCVEIRAGDSRLVFDAGSGMRRLGQDLVENDHALDTPIFLTHFHWDHIQGFPFFLPLYAPERELHIIGPAQNGIDVQSLFAGQMGPIYFPVPFSAVAAALTFGHLNEGSWEGEGFSLRTIRVRHPSYVVGYRVEVGGRTICFIPDNELEGTEYPVEPGWRDRLVEFVAGADLLLHDSMYTDEEYEDRRGWGHSTFRQSIRLAEEAGVESLLFFHHDPERTDDQLDDIVGRLRDEILARGSSLDVGAAHEGIDLTLEEK